MGAKVRANHNPAWGGNMRVSRAVRTAVAGAAVVLIGFGAPAVSAPSPDLVGQSAGPKRQCTKAEIAAFVADDPPLVGYADCEVLAPGRTFDIDDMNGEHHTCYFSFAYRGVDKRNYLSSLGSCYLTPSCLEVLGIKLPVCLITAYSEYEPFYKPGKGIPVTVSDIQVGELAYAVYDGTFDFSLIRLDPRIPFTPAVCGFGGPTGIETAVRTDPEPLLLSESGFQFTSVAVRGLYHHLHVANVEGFPSAGAPLMTQTGKAVGVGIGLGIGTNAGDIVERVSLPLARARYRTRLGLSLMTAPLL